MLGWMALVLMHALVAGAEGQTASVPAPRLLLDSKAQAAKACGFRNSKWSCSENALKRFNIAETLSPLEGVEPDLSLKVLPQGVRCTDSLDISMSHPSKAIQVDWSKAAILINGQAVRVRTSKSGAETMDVPAGAYLAATVRPLKAECLQDNPKDPKFPGDSLELVFPYRVGGEDRLAKWKVTRAWVEETEANAMGMVAAPTLPSHTLGPSGLRNLGLALLVTSVTTGVAVATAAFLTFGVTLGSAVLLVAASSSGANDDLFNVAFVTFLGGLICSYVAFFGGLSYFFYGAPVPTVGVGMLYVAKTTAERDELSQASVLAWHKRRKELGITAAEKE